MLGQVTREEDAMSILVVADTHDHLLFFTNRGKVFRIKCHEVPDSSRTAKGLAVVNLFPVAEGERVTAMVNIATLRPDTYLLMATIRGEIKKTSLDKFAVVRSSGLIAMDLERRDELINASLATNDDDVMLITEKGQATRFKVSELRSSSRTSGGVRGIRLAPKDRVVSMVIPYPDGYLLVVTTNGFGKITPVDSYPRHHRGGGGVKAFKLTEKRDKVADAGMVSLSHQIMIISANGIVLRTSIKVKDHGISIQGRSTQGVGIMRLDKGDSVVAIACFDKSEKPR